MKKKIVAAVQSSYIPWKGYFDMINMADEFIFYDDVQFTKEDWRTRNRIKTQAGPKWLTVPCTGGSDSLICDVQVLSHHWQRKHWTTICHSYSKAPFFKDYKALFEDLYLAKQWQSLSEMNQTFVKRISTEILGIKTVFRDSRDFSLVADQRKEDRWLGLLAQTGTSDFVIGPSARNYLTEEKQAKVTESGINLIWMDYSGYKEYPQLFTPFEHSVSIIDLIFNTGPDARHFMKSFG